MIKNSYDLALDKGNAIVAVPFKDSIREIVGSETKAVDRNNFYLVQTPQTFDLKLVKEAYNQDYHGSFTDDAAVLESNGTQINIVEGDEKNIKITTEVDLKITELFLQNQESNKI